MKLKRALPLYGIGFALLILISITGISVLGEAAAPTAAPPSPAPTVTAEPQLRDDTLLHDTSLIAPDPNCLPPCWHGITPGETLWNDALSILGSDPILEITKIAGDNETQAMAAEFQEKGGTNCCQLFTQDRRKVSIIFLRVAPTMTMRELIAAQGKPSYLVGSPYTSGQAALNLLYPSKALVVYAFVAGINSSLSENSEIVATLYMQPADMDLLVRTSALYTWKGYQSFRTYNNNQFDLMPSVTLTPTPP